MTWISLPRVEKFNTGFPAFLFFYILDQYSSNIIKHVKHPMTKTLILDFNCKEGKLKQDCSFLVQQW